MHIPVMNYLAAVKAAKQAIEKAKSDDGKIDAGEALEITMATLAAFMTGISTSSPPADPSTP